MNSSLLEISGNTLFSSWGLNQMEARSLLLTLNKLLVIIQKKGVHVYRVVESLGIQIRGFKQKDLML